MSEIENPHDKLIRLVFSDPMEASSFLQANLPKSLTKEFDWTTLTVVKRTFIDDEFRDTASDMLFLVKTFSTGKDIFFYILFEHQSKPLKWMRFRLLKYMCRIWDESFKMFPKQHFLLPVVPLVFYQGQKSWNYSTKFRDLFRPSERRADFIPDFGHFLVDQSGIKSEEVKGTLKVKITQLLMLAAYHNEVRDEVFDILPGLLAQISQQPTNGLNYPAIFVRYLAETQSPEEVEKLIERTKQLSVEVGEEMLTATQTLTSQVEKRGSLAKEIEMVEKFLKAGAPWEMVVNATGITPEKLQELKATLQEMMAGQTQLEGSHPLS